MRYLLLGVLAMAMLPAVAEAGRRDRDRWSLGLSFGYSDGGSYYGGSVAYRDGYYGGRGRNHDYGGYQDRGYSRRDYGGDRGRGYHGGGYYGGESYYRPAPRYHYSPPQYYYAPQYYYGGSGYCW